MFTSCREYLVKRSSIYGLRLRFLIKLIQGTVMQMALRGPVTDLPVGQFLQIPVHPPFSKNIPLFDLVETGIEPIPSRALQGALRDRHERWAAGGGGRFQCERRTHCESGRRSRVGLRSRARFAVRDSKSPLFSIACRVSAEKRRAQLFGLGS